jgi:hypothetical protein
LASPDFIDKINKDFKTDMFSQELGSNFIDTLLFSGKHVVVRNKGAYHFRGEHD